MPTLPLRLGVSAPALHAGLDRIRAEIHVPGEFPPEALAEAREAAARGPAPPGGGEPSDLREVPFLTIDPAGSRDLDQALWIGRRGDGYRVRYAIADVAAFVAPGGALDAETRRRGVTHYMPDGRAPLHPPEIGEGAASLLPGAERAAVVWTIDLAGDGRAASWGAERALVQSRAALSYEEAQSAIDAGDTETLGLLRAVGELRLEEERSRGGVSLGLPAQVVVPAGDGYALRYDAPPPVEGWNAQVSLLTGMCAARTMIDGGLGLFRTLPPADARAIARLRRAGRALGRAWPEEATYAEIVRSLDPALPADAALLVQAAHALRGAGYTAWRRGDGEPPEHSAVAAPYAHVTAPIRRLCDRFATEVALAQLAGREPPAWAADALPALPDLMADALRRQGSVERAVLDYLEAELLLPRVGETFRGVVVDEDRDRVVVQLTEPAVVTSLRADGLRLGQELELRLVSADPAARRVELEPS